MGAVIRPTDATYLVACEHATWFGRVALGAAGPLNVLAGFWLLVAFKEASRPREVARPAP